MTPREVCAVVFALVAPLEGDGREELLQRLAVMPGTTAAAERAARLLGQVTV